MGIFVTNHIEDPDDGWPGASFDSLSETEQFVRYRNDDGYTWGIWERDGEVYDLLAVVFEGQIFRLASW